MEKEWDARGNRDSPVSRLENIQLHLEKVEQAIKCLGLSDQRLDHAVSKVKTMTERYSNQGKENKQRNVKSGERVSVSLDDLAERIRKIESIFTIVKKIHKDAPDKLEAFYLKAEKTFPGLEPGMALIKWEDGLRRRQTP